MANQDNAIYYRHFKGNYYQYLHIVKHTETREDLVVYKALYGDGRIWARPKQMFFDCVETENGAIRRFQPVSAAEIESHVRKALQPKYSFPNIDYSDEFVPLQNKEAKGFSKPVKGMAQTLANKNIFVLSEHTDASTDDELDKAINGRIAASEGSEQELRAIFHMIEIWGGSAGRMLYLKKGFDWNIIQPKYNDLVGVCLSARGLLEETLNAVVNAVSECEKIPEFGAAFITKHSRYWLQKSLKAQALPIFDSIMAHNILGMKDAPTSARLKEYWEVMVDKSDLESISLVNLERKLFKYFTINKI